jgi:SAM-dependent methyltransferase
VSCCDGPGGPSCYDDQFDAEHARRKQREYRKAGPGRWTGWLIGGLAEGGVDGATVLDIGAGVGAVHLGLLARGAGSATDVDASGPYLVVAQEEAERAGVGDRVRHVRADFATLTDPIGPADLVALDRVVCCYDDMPALVGRAAALTRHRLGLVYPRDALVFRALLRVVDAFGALRRDPFRVYLHRTAAVEAVASAAGLRAVAREHGFFWQTVIFERPEA